MWIGELEFEVLVCVDECVIWFIGDWEIVKVVVCVFKIVSIVVKG